MNDDLNKYFDASFPIMDMFKKVTPGTQKHCIAVSNFCESIGKEINLKNVEILKCAALYHDIGKMLNPSYFIENQNGENPHDIIKDPFISYQLISRHVSDSVLILHQNHFPDNVIDIVSEHHGDTCVKFFYSIATKNIKEKVVLCEMNKEYRYKCSKPQSTESAILMICDVIEAASRSKFTSGQLDSNECIVKMITGLTDDLINDGQLDNLKIGTLKKIKSVLIKEVESLYHNRIAYPENDDEEKTIGEIRDIK